MTPEEFEEAFASARAQYPGSMSIRMSPNDRRAIYLLAKNGVQFKLLAEYFQCSANTITNIAGANSKHHKNIRAEYERDPRSFAKYVTEDMLNKLVHKDLAIKQTQIEATRNRFKNMHNSAVANPLANHSAGDHALYPDEPNDCRVAYCRAADINDAMAICDGWYVFALDSSGNAELYLGPCRTSIHALTAYRTGNYSLLIKPGDLLENNSPSEITA